MCPGRRPPLDVRLAASAGLFADAALDATTGQPEPAPPRAVDAVTVRLVKVITVAEVTMPLEQAREVWV